MPSANHFETKDAMLQRAEQLLVEVDEHFQAMGDDVRHTDKIALARAITHLAEQYRSEQH